MTTRIVLVTFALLMGCGQPGANVSGQVTAKANALTVVATSPGLSRITAPVDPSGHFTLTLPAGNRYLLRFVDVIGGTPLVVGTAVHRKSGHKLVITPKPDDDGRVELGEVGDRGLDLDAFGGSPCFGFGQDLGVEHDEDGEIEQDAAPHVRDGHGRGMGEHEEDEGEGDDEGGMKCGLPFLFGGDDRDGGDGDALCPTACNPHFGDTDEDGGDAGADGGRHWSR